MNTDPHETAASKVSPAPDFNSEFRFSALPPTNPDAIAVNVMYVGALSSTADNKPETQQKCQGASRASADARALRISSAGTSVTNMPRNNAAISRIGER